MVEIPKEYRYKIIHVKCGKIAYYYKHWIRPGDPLRCEDAMYPDGKHPKYAEPHICWSCKKWIPLDTSAIRQEPRDDT